MRWAVFAALLLCGMGAASGQYVVTFGDITPPSGGDGLTIGYVQHVAVHPLDARKVAVAGPNRLMVSRDGGATWNRPEQLPWHLNWVERLFAHNGRPGVLFVQEAGLGNPPYGVRGFGRTWRSDDFGETWSLVNEYRGEGDRAISPYASNPRDPEHLYATQRRLAVCGIGCFWPARWDDEGLVESRDGGKSWGSTMAFAPRTRKTGRIDGPVPAAATRLFLVDFDGAMVSHDGGRRWSDFGLPGQPLWIRQDPRNADVLYASIRSSEGAHQVVRSADSGHSWHTVFSYEPYVVPHGPTFGFAELAIDPVDTRRLWITGIKDGVYLSEDAGTTWRPLGMAAVAQPFQGDVLDLGSIPGVLVPSAGDSPQGYLIRQGRLYRVELAPRQRIAVEYQYGNRFWIAGDGGEAHSQDYRANDAVRTGYRFGLWSRADAPPEALGFCRFQGNPAHGQTSRFVSLAGAECEAVKRGRDFLLEGENEYFAVPADDFGGCATGLVPVHRFNNLEANVNHRYVADPALAEQMHDSGWADEGVQFCARPLGSNE